jgi:hypothetical protein
LLHQCELLLRRRLAAGTSGERERSGDSPSKLGHEKPPSSSF